MANSAPLLSTPDDRILEEDHLLPPQETISSLSEEQLYLTYEIHRTIEEIRAGSYSRIALQFPDHLLVDSPRVYRALSRGLKNDSSSLHKRKIFILADSSYGACCVDEVAAEHADADLLVHYGRSCLSPVERLPVIYCFTIPPLDLKPVVHAFEKLYPDPHQQIILMADLPYATRIPELHRLLNEQGYSRLFATEQQSDLSSPIPNRSLPPEVENRADLLRQYHLFHISDPPPALLLTLASRLASIHIYPTSQSSSSSPQTPISASSAIALRRRYALVTSLTTVPIFGILINTLSVKNYMSILSHVKSMISAAGKKYYTFVVGKLNPAKLANFSEVGGWVVIGCWESSLFDSKDFWKPIITPYELELALAADNDRVWTGDWSSDFTTLLTEKPQSIPVPNTKPTIGHDIDAQGEENIDDESTPPEYHLRTGRYVSDSRPMNANHLVAHSLPSSGPVGSSSLIKRAGREVAQINGHLSPAAEYLNNKRTWQGLGSDFAVAYDDDSLTPKEDAALVEQGRKGIAKGYSVGDSSSKS